MSKIERLSYGHQDDLPAVTGFLALIGSLELIPILIRFHPKFNAIGNSINVLFIGCGKKLKKIK